MVPDFMAGGGNASGDFGQPLHVHPTHEESGRNVMTRQYLQ
jgi:hypothetical protein